MAAKLLHSLADDNPDLQKQIGCMTGIFQIFDRHHIVAAGRHTSHRRLLPGNSQFSIGTSDGEYNNIYHRQTEVNLSKSASEKQRISTESSRASFSSSCSSSLSSLDCNKTGQPEASDRIIFPETPSRDPVMNQAKQSLDLRDVVKDSMYREARGLSVKTNSRDEALARAAKHGDTPRPPQLSKSVDGSYRAGINSKRNLPVDLRESLRVLAKLQEVPWYYNEAREVQRLSSYEAKDGSWKSISKDAPRYSCDGREMNRSSFESRDSFKLNPKLKELPRLSLDGREGSMRGSNSVLKPNYFSKNLQANSDCNENMPSLSVSTGNQKRPPSVVAKLMGLEALPDSSLSNSQLGLVKSCPTEDTDLILESLRTSYPIRTSNSPKNSFKGPTSPRWKNSDSVMKPVLSSRVPIEPAPWRQADGSRVSQKSTLRPVKAMAKTPDTYPSVYSEIEKRLKDLEFKQSGKDLRALKQILEAMQAKGLLETSKEEEASNFETQQNHELKSTSPSVNSKLLGQRNLINHNVNTSVRGSTSMTYESPIVIMKPAKRAEDSGPPDTSLIPIDGLSVLRKPNSAESKRASVNQHIAKDQSLKSSQRQSTSSNSAERKSSSRITKASPSLTRPQQSSKESNASSLKSSGSISPRLQQKKLELEKRSRPPTPPSDSNKPRRQSNRQPPESGSPGGKLRPKSRNMQQSDDQLSQISSDSRTSSYQGDDLSLQLDSNIIMGSSKTDTEVTSTRQSSETNGSRSPCVEAVKNSVSDLLQKISSLRSSEEVLLADPGTVAPEHPSPVSVLDTSVYRDDEPSPVKQIPIALKGDNTQDSNDNPTEDQWNQTEKIFSENMGTGISSQINRKKLQSIDNLVQKLRRLNSSHDEAQTDYIASLCENTNPDHRYISEILLASGLLLRDLGSSFITFQLHPSGHPINPELFFVLEQTKASTLITKEECGPRTKPDPEKFHRKLIFDTVNEILARKLAFMRVSQEPWLKRSGKLSKKTLSAQKLLKELCFEMEQLQAKKPESTAEEEDSLKCVLWDDVMHRSEDWTDFIGEISGLVLDVERSIFKELVDEVLAGEAASFRAKLGRRRQLFVK